MKYLLCTIALWLTFSCAALADQDGIRQTIERQITAFQNDDVAGAFTHASPTIQRLFGTAERFGSMVKNGYPMVWRPSDVRFLDLREIAGAQWQKVQIRDQGGAFHLLDYQMINLNGVWRINGVQLLPAPDVGA